MAQNTTVATAGPPKFLNMVHEELKPGRDGAYNDLETSIVHTYNHENIPVFWLELQSLTGPSELLYLNSFDSSEEMDKAAEALRIGLASRPKLMQMQDRLLQDNISSTTTVLGIRRDDVGYRTNTIDFSKMRMLRLTTIFIHPGFERAFLEAQWSLAEASQKARSEIAWAVYEVTAGIPQPSFVIVTPMHSFEDLGGPSEAVRAAQKDDAGALEDHLQELARIAYGTSDTRLFAVHPETCHVSKEFAAGDPDFWSPATLSAPPSTTAKSAKPTPKGTPSLAPKP
jgi:hypothetical protein